MLYVVIGDEIKMPRLDSGHEQVIYDWLGFKSNCLINSSDRIRVFKSRGV